MPVPWSKQNVFILFEINYQPDTPLIEILISNHGGFPGLYMSVSWSEQNVFIPFEISDQSDTPLTEIEPNIQFYLETN